MNNLGNILLQVIISLFYINFSTLSHKREIHGVYTFRFYELEKLEALGALILKNHKKENSILGKIISIFQLEAKFVQFHILKYYSFDVYLILTIFLVTENKIEN
jgi:hypothetical protein